MRYLVSYWFYVRPRIFRIEKEIVVTADERGTPLGSLLAVANHAIKSAPAMLDQVCALSLAECPKGALRELITSCTSVAQTLLRVTRDERKCAHVSCCGETTNGVRHGEEDTETLAYGDDICLIRGLSQDVSAT